MAVTVSVGGGWGAGAWGAMPWGGGSIVLGALALVDAVAVRENVIRLEFTVPIYFSGILDPFDASDVARHFGIEVVTGTVGLDAEPVRGVRILAASLPTEADGISEEQFGRFLDLSLDRPMTPYPARYTVSVRDIYDVTFTSGIAMSTRSLFAVFKRIEPPQLETTLPSRDIANPQTLLAAEDPLPDSQTGFLGTLRYDDQGDVAFDEGLTSYKKRVFRRLFTKKNGFAHLPGYGVGVPQYGKRLGSPINMSTMAAEAEAQIALEPETEKVRCRPILDRSRPGLARLQIVAKPKTGKPQAFDVPFASS